MNEMPKVAAESLLPVVRERIEDAVRKILDAVNSTPPGELITGSEEAARDIGHELVRGVYEAALQQRITAAEAAFSPSTGCGDRPQAAESREAAHDRAMCHGPRQSAADVVVFPGERPRRAVGCVDHGGRRERHLRRARDGLPTQQRRGQL